MSTPVWISLGSNLGDRRAILDDAVAALSQVPGVVVKKVSSYHETKPIGGPPGQGPFLNAAAHLEISLDPFQLLSELQRIENEAGRVRVIRWGERTLDLDILIFGTKFLDTRELKLPHPRLAFRRFVLAPLVEIAPQIVDTMTKRTVTDLLANLDRMPRLLALEGVRDRLQASIFDRLVQDLPAYGIAEADLESVPEMSDDPFKRFIETLEVKIKILRSSFWMKQSLRVPWIVTDFSLGFDFRQAMTTSWRNGPPGEEASKRMIEIHRKRTEVLKSAVDVVRPKVVLVLPTNERSLRKPGVSTDLRLWPDSDDPEAIVAEVVATCRGIEGV